ncbi:Smr/MutS family protein [Sneathiella marina]|uniref:Smr/MutS family protein n=1 Tax=Sneathiella marina TaxID=2950108 RepID=A0ABY4W3I9_9PROT|nr:Smr/MutS family protein [Sneathiella marina]USG61381.1 Smr/MutS family protein [Sneathiella marina]
MSKKPDRPKGLSKTDRDLWDYVTRNIDRQASNRFIGFDVRPAGTGAGTNRVSPAPPPVSGRKPPINPEKLAKAMASRPVDPASERRDNTPRNPSQRENVPGLDRRNSERLRKGQMAIDGKVDLHGMTQAEAHTRLRTFISAAQMQGKRCVLVVTGKGSRGQKTEDAAFMGSDRRGILREAVPKWLAAADMRRLVIDFRNAQPKHGGSGALYVLLRRDRS